MDESVAKLRSIAGYSILGASHVTWACNLGDKMWKRGKSIHIGFKRAPDAAATTSLAVGVYASFLQSDPPKRQGPSVPGVTRRD